MDTNEGERGSQRVRGTSAADGVDAAARGKGKPVQAPPVTENPRQRAPTRRPSSREVHEDTGLAAKVAALEAENVELRDDLRVMRTHLDDLHRLCTTHVHYVRSTG